MWCFKKDMFCREHILFRWFIIFKTVCLSSIFGRSGRCPSSSRHVPRGTHLCICAYFVHMLIFTIVCTIVRTIFSIGPGFEPLALHTIFFVGQGIEPLPLQHNLFVGPGFGSLALIACFRPGVSLAYFRKQKYKKNWKNLDKIKMSGLKSRKILNVRGVYPKIFKDFGWSVRLPHTLRHTSIFSCPAGFSTSLPPQMANFVSQEFNALYIINDTKGGLLLF